MSLSDVLAQVDHWPVDTVAVGVTDADGTLATHGAVDRVFPLASVTKPLAAWAALVAVQDGLLHLDEPAGPDGATVRHLFAHASGLPLEEGGIVSTVGRLRIYSNAGFELLGRLVEERADLPFAEHLDLEVLAPLGMTDTRLDGSPARAAHGTVTDLLAFGRELLRPELLDDELATAAATVQFPGLAGVVPGYGRQTENPWGLGLEIRGAKTPHWTGPGQSPATFGHFGQAGTYLWVDRTLGVACCFLGDRDFGDWSREHWAPFNQAVHDAVAPA